MESGTFPVETVPAQVRIKHTCRSCDQLTYSKTVRRHVEARSAWGFTRKSQSGLGNKIMVAIFSWLPGRLVAQHHHSHACLTNFSCSAGHGGMAPELP